MRPEPSFARSLVAFVNASLRGEQPADAFDVYARATNWSRSLRFIDGTRSFDDAASWLGALKAAGATRLLWVPKQTPGIERIVIDAAEPSVWQHHWERAKEAKAAPWFDVSFTRQDGAVTIPAKAREVGEVLAALDAALVGLVELSKRADLGGWGDFFGAALAVARGEAKGPMASPLPPTAPVAAHRLAAAANASDAFGGMGSWNDFNPLPESNDERERGRFSDALYRCIEEALDATAG